MKIAYSKMKNEDRCSLVDEIIAVKKGIFLFDGLSGSGKSMLLNAILAKSENTKRFSDESFTENLLAELWQANHTDKGIANIADSLKSFSVIGIEDIDFQSGKPVTLECIANVINVLAEETLIIITGIDIKERALTLTEKLQNPQFLYFE